MIGDLQSWLDDKAFPLWAGAGIDRATGTVWEALDHTGAPCAEMPRRLRVQLRQAYCFAGSEQPTLRNLALQLFRFAMDRGFDAENGNLAAWLAPDTSLLTAPHDLYDMAFMLLAASALIEAGFDIADDLARLERELDRLKAPRGWYENAARALPRRQNPHMHIFEAATLLFGATGQERFLRMAEECLDLFSDVFLADDGRVLEYFTADWTPLGYPDQTVEPGHMAEWIYLLDRFEALAGRKTELSLPQLYRAVLARRDEAGLLPDRADPMAGSRRLWPQTEFLKATIAMRRRGAQIPQAPAVEEILGKLWHQYLDTDVPGGWYDKRSSGGALLSDNMPASTFYHIFVAFRFYMSGRTSA
jgi:mannose/cellobiose epimerase-like protein (N-acyl-D-glucosamine 2-epimerase family)